MTLQDFIAEFRSQRTDAVVPYFWSDAEIISYLNSAINEACERAKLIEDRSTPAVSQITLVAAQGDYVLHPSVIQVKRITYAGQMINPTSVEQLDLDDPLWETRTGDPKTYVLTGTTGLRLVPIPTAGTVAVTSTIALTVFRTQLVPFDIWSDYDSSPEVPDIYHIRMMPWLYRCALLKTDSDRFDPVKAAEQEAIFEVAFGVRPDANVRRKWRDRRPPVTVMQF